MPPEPTPESTEKPKEDPKANSIDLDDDFENEPLGERQEEACSLEEGCESCQ